MKALDGHGKSTAILVLSLAVGLQIGYNVLCLETPAIAGDEKVSYIAGLSLLGWIAYFVAGIYVGHNLGAVRQWIKSVTTLPYSLVAVVASGVVCLTWMDGIRRYGGFYDIPPSALVVPEILAPLLCFTTILVAYRWWGFSGSRVLDILGDYSLWIFLVHVLFIDAVRFALGFVGLTYESWPFYVITFIAVCTLCVASTAVLKRIPHNHILGGPRSHGTTDTSRAP
jgi:membrane-bound acyltransferase YfiQ involved in biofilm formation